MAFSRLVLSLLVLSIEQCFASVEVPVYAWGSLDEFSLKRSPLHTVHLGELDNILKGELKHNPFTVIFIEETLSVEDFSRRNFDGDNSFPYLQSEIGRAIYLPTVVDPLRLLNKLAKPLKANHVTLSERGLSHEIEPENGKFLFINLKDAKEGESRSDLLRRHDDFIWKTIAEFQDKHEAVVGIYTAHHPSWSVQEASNRVRRAAPRSPRFTNQEFAGLLISFSQVRVGNYSAPDNYTSISGSEQILNGTKQLSTLFFIDPNNAEKNVNVTLNFWSQGGYWLLDSVTYVKGSSELELYAHSQVYALIDYSYLCGPDVTFSTVNDSTQYSVTFENLQIQPYFNTNATGLKFGDTFDCVGFFSIGIWAGLFVTFILLAITFFGIMMMMDIKTMDRFDDPKGKTITVNAGE